MQVNYIILDFTATDADNDDLSWTINWGDSQIEVDPCPSNFQQKQGWTYNPSHIWNTAGAYNVKVTVSDCRVELLQILLL